MISGLIKARNLTLTGQCYAACRCYCENKSIYQIDEEGKKPKTVHGKLYPEWRKPWIERDGEFQTKLGVFVRSNPNPNVLSLMQKVPAFNTTVMRDWWREMKELHQTENQKYISRRVEILGSNLAALHYFIHREASVRLKHAKKWLLGDEKTLKSLPITYQKGFEVEAIDCSTFMDGGIRYEGLDNLQDLAHLKWLSLKNNKFIDVWGFDRIAGNNGHTLEYLDISGCDVTAGCINALARMTNLKLLVITDPGDDDSIQTGLSLLEEENPNLIIKIIDNSVETKALGVE